MASNQPPPLIMSQQIPEELLVTEINKNPTNLIDQLKSNPYFGAGAGLFGIGVLMSILKKSTALAYTVAQKNLTVSLDVVSKDKSYVWVLRWINEHLAKRAQHINVDTFFARNERSQVILKKFNLFCFSKITFKFFKKFQIH